MVSGADEEPGMIVFWVQAPGPGSGGWRPSWAVGVGVAAFRGTARLFDLGEDANAWRVSAGPDWSWRCAVEEPGFEAGLEGARSASTEHARLLK